MLQTILLALVAFGIGLVLLLWGYRAFLVMLPIFGFFAGLWLGAQAISAIFGTGFLADVTGLVVGLIVGLVVAVLAYLFYDLFVALVAAAIGYGLGTGLMEAIGLDFWLIAVPVGVVLAILVVVLAFALNLQKYVIIGLMAIAGANALITSALLLFGTVTPEEIQLAGNSIRAVVDAGGLLLVVWLVLTIVGIFYQIRTNRVYHFDSDEYVLYYV